MLKFAKKSLELKIIIAICLVTSFVIGTFTIIDIRLMRSDTIRTATQGLKPLAAAIKAGVTVSMKKGHQEDVQHIIDKVNIPGLVERVFIYDEDGRVLKSSAGSVLPPEEAAKSIEAIRHLGSEDRFEIGKYNGSYFMSFYSAMPNERECHRCHGSKNRLNGILRMDFSLKGVYEVVSSSTMRMLAWAGVLLSVLIVSLVILLRILIHRPINEFKKAMDEAVRSNRPPSLDITGEDELAELQRGFISMLNTLRFLHQTAIEKEREIVRGREMIRFRQELQAMFNAMPDGVLLVDRDLRIIQSNPRAYELLPGLDQAAGRMDPERLKLAGCPNHGILRAFEDGRIYEHQCAIKLPDGETKHLHSICAPIIDQDGRVTHVVDVIRDNTDRVRIYQELEEKTAELFAANRLLAQVAITDSLTQLYNRRHFDELLYKEIKRYSRRKYSALSLMMIDIDDFKDINDRYGHLAGDNVLAETGRIIKESVRETDTVARYGGEEIVVVMPDAHIESAAYKAELIRRRIESKDFPGHGGHFHITISIGLAAYGSGTPQDLIKAADDALYQAKRAGKNRVVVGEKSVASI